jgi:hypothetical protein
VSNDAAIIFDQSLVTQGEYEGHHLLCPMHGRQVPEGYGLFGAPPDPARAACGCQPVILWLMNDWGEHPALEVDHLGIGRVRFAR